MKKKEKRGKKKRKKEMNQAARALVRGRFYHLYLGRLLMRIFPAARRIYLRMPPDCAFHFRPLRLYRTALKFRAAGLLHRLRGAHVALPRGGLQAPRVADGFVGLRRRRPLRVERRPHATPRGVKQN